MITTEVLVIYDEVNGYQIDNVNGWIPAVSYTFNGSTGLIVCSKALKYNLREKEIIWLLEEYIYNSVSNQYNLSKTYKFTQINNDSTLITNNSVMYEGMPAFDSYLANLGKPIMYPLIQDEIVDKLIS